MKRLARLGAISASIATAGCLTVGMGVASADTIINTGPGSYNAILAKSSFSQTVRNVNNVNLNNRNYQVAVTGSAFVSGNTHSYGSNNNRCNYSRNVSYVPMHKMKHMYAVMPSHHYQAPAHHAQYSTYMRPSYGAGGHDNYSSGGQGGSATTGNASNYNATHENVSITNNTPTLSSAPTSLGSNGTISDTGPHSFNLISSRSNINEEVTNTNNVDITNTNTQTAVSGNATVSGNTRGGSARTGNATNTNSTDIEVAISNN